MAATTPTTTARHHPSTLWLLVLAVALGAALIVAGVSLSNRIDVGTVTDDDAAVAPVPADRLAHAEQMAVAGAELTALRATARDVPVTAAALHDRTALVRLVTTGVVPVEALRPALAPAAADRVVHAGQMATANAELRGLDSAVRDTPAISDALHDRVVLLRLVAAGDVPVETLGQVQR